MNDKDIMEQYVDYTMVDPMVDPEREESDGDKVASAILVLAREVRDVASALRALGNGGAATDMGDVDGLSI